MLKSLEARLRRRLRVSDETQEKVNKSQKEDRDKASRIQRGIAGVQDDNWQMELGLVIRATMWEESSRLRMSCLGKRKTRARLTRAERRKHNQHWAKTADESASVRLKQEQEEDPYI